MRYVEGDGSYGTMTYEEARNLVQSKRRDINPNPGFIQQLRVWDIIKDKLDDPDYYPEYRHWRMSHEAKIIASMPFKLCN